MNFTISKKFFDKSKLYETKNYKIYSFLNFKKIKFERICVINIIENNFTFLHSIRFYFFMEDALLSNNLSALEWFKNSGYELKHNVDVLNACMHENIEILEWFKRNNLKIKLSIACFSYPISYGNIEFLEWFKQNNYLKNKKIYIDTSIECGKIECLDWFKSIGFKIKYNYSALIDAYNYNHIFSNSKNNFYLFYAWLKKNNYKHKNYKKMIKICRCKYIEFKTKNKYLKGYNKN